MSESPLARRLTNLIRLNGPLSVAEWMAICLSDPAHGYYMGRDPFGAAGDFVTAPEISQMFGELLAAWVIDAWEKLGRPRPVRLVELGPGRGTLTADLLRAARLRPAFLAAADLHLVETSPHLRRAQAETLARAPLAPTWHARLAKAPEGPLLVLANEFFDCLPVRQYVRVGDLWRERVVGLAEDGSFRFGLGAGVLDPRAAPEIAAPEGAVFEISAASTGLMAEIGRRIVEHGGAALVIDYGHGASGFGDTLQALGRHASRNPLERPGDVDITAHVDFAALDRAAREAGAATHGPVAQGAFLIRLGLLERAGALGRGKPADVQERLTREVARLAGEDQMGRLFKVLAVTSLGLMPAGF